MAETKLQVGEPTQPPDIDQYFCHYVEDIVK